MLEAGQRFPDFSLENQDGKSRTLASYAGKWLVLYVYPKDDTPGCTIQGKSFTATKADFDAAGAIVVGLSADDVDVAQGLLQQVLASRSSCSPIPRRSSSARSAFRQSEYKGTMYWDRTTFLVDPSGVVRKVYANVDPHGHEQALLKDIAALQGS